MNVEALVLMLEEHLTDIRQRLVATAWRGFVDLLDETAKSLTPSHDKLEGWADRVSAFLSQHDYTRGLLQGLLFCAGLKMRGVPVDMPGLGDAAAPGAAPARARPTPEQELVVRIQSIARRARSLE